jgi:hypothetical protein
VPCTRRAVSSRRRRTTIGRGWRERAPAFSYLVGVTQRGYVVTRSRRAV